MEVSQTAAAVAKELKKLGTSSKAKASAWFFKTGKGQYGHGDVFIGVTVPEQRKIARRFTDLPLTEIEKLLQSKIHECRLTALIILVRQYDRGSSRSHAEIVRLYLRNRRRVNNWDLVDSSAPQILGRHLLNRDRRILYKLARSNNVWDQRIAILSTQAFIRKNDFTDTLKISELLLQNRHDLIHKAVGWMLREVGDRSLKTEEVFLKKHALVMPRVMLRYAIEKFPENKRKKFLQKVRYTVTS
ncbi:DNA alkylation repair protein [Candidatus Uhrbacteria bacterium]|nr:DNA alkylation repair protein [Candidatus Uhrbacteria bacterium]